MYLKILFIYLFIAINECQTSNLKFAATIIRHGDRTPISFYPNDPWADEKYWPNHFGQLTETGMRQLYDLGVKYRQLYGNLLSMTYNDREIFVRTTDFDRTIMSAESYLAGLYRVDTDKEFVPGLPWKPVPIRAIPNDIDDLLGMKAPCPRYDFENSKFEKSDAYQRVFKDYEKTLHYMTENTGMEVDTFIKASYIYDALFVEEKYNYTLPNWTAKVYPDTLINISKYCFLFQTYNKEMKRLKSGPIIKEIVNFMDNICVNDTSYKFVLYAAHDTTLAAVLNSLGLFNPHLPVYAAHMTFELYSLENSTTDNYTVRIMYQGEALNIPNCGTVCSFSKFKALYQWLIPENHAAECQLKVYKANHWKLAGGVFILLAIFCLISTSVFIFRSPKDSRYLPYHDSHIIITHKELNEK